MVAMRVSRIKQARERRGSTLVEAALMLNLVVLPTFLGVFEYGRLVMVRQLMLNAAREGARMAVVGTASNPPVTTSQIQTAAMSYLAPMGRPLAGLAVSVYQADPSTGQPIGAWDQAPYGGAVAVKITGDYAPILPVLLRFGTKPMSLKAVAMMRSEAN
jgi:Flp pilus assembly protein TadG